MTSRLVVLGKFPQHLAGLLVHPQFIKRTTVTFDFGVVLGDLVQ